MVWCREVYLFSSVVGPAVAFETDGEIILSVFVPAIVIVVVVVVIWACWSLYKENRDDVLVYDPFLDKTIQNRYPSYSHPPATKGRIVNAVSQPLSCANSPLTFDPGTKSVSLQCSGNSVSRPSESAGPMSTHITHSSRDSLQDITEDSQELMDRMTRFMSGNALSNDFNSGSYDKSIVQSHQRRPMNPYCHGACAMLARNVFTLKENFLDGPSIFENVGLEKGDIYVKSSSKRKKSKFRLKLSHGIARNGMQTHKNRKASTSKMKIRQPRVTSRDLQKRVKENQQMAEMSIYAFCGNINSAFADQEFDY